MNQSFGLQRGARVGLPWYPKRRTAYGQPRSQCCCQANLDLITTFPGSKLTSFSCPCWFTHPEQTTRPVPMQLAKARRPRRFSRNPYGHGAIKDRVRRRYFGDPATCGL